jgi:nucleoprotein TPR
LQQLKSSSSTSSSEVETLRTRITALEAANRDTLAVVASKTAANDSLSQDLQKQHQKGLELTQQISALQQSIQNANSAVSSAKFREQSLKQELEQAKRNNEWLDTELKTKSAEALKFRKEKGARIAELQRQNEEANASVDALKRTEVALRSRLDDMQKKAEESLSKVQQLQEAAATIEEGFRQELESSRRLAELQTQQTETHRNRLREVEASLEKARDDAAAEIAKCRQDAESESQERERLENRIAELEAEVDRLEASASAPVYQGSAPQTPRQGLNGLLRAGSPTVFGTPGSVRGGKSVITATQAIDELYKVKGQLATERRKNERLTAEMEEMMQGLEAKQPEIEELQNEHQRLQHEVIQMSKFVDATSKERDRFKKDARKAISDAKTSEVEINILRQQLQDLSTQVKMLLLELDVRERGLEALSPEEREQLARVARGEVGEDSLEGLTDTDRFISQHLTVFRSVTELQEKNQELLRITREVAAKMESEEAISQKHQAAEDHAKVQELERQCAGYVDEIKALLMKSESYVKERDMFRRMLQHRGQIPANADLESLFGQSVDGHGFMNSMNSVETPNGKDNANYAALLRELQAHFDQYREEQATDRRTLKEQADKLASEKSGLQSEIAKISSQLSLASERYDMLHANYTMLQNENMELQKRSQILSESAAKQDLRTQQVAEDLIEARGLLESMRNETANLKAEKKLWKEIQDRLNQDNENLMSERSRLNALIASQQSLQNERDLSESETRRRLQTQVETLESELTATKRKLADEVEDNKKAQLRKEYDAQQSQKRIDELAGTLSTIREELVAAKTTRDHLQARVDELTIELKSAEERVEVLQPKPTPRPGTQAAADASEDTISREQELAIEVSELKRDLDLTKSELEATKSQIEQYKSISQSSEEDLQNFQETHEQYRQEMDAIIEEKDGRLRELQQRVEDLSSELTNTNNELNTLRNEQSETARQAAEEKSALEAEITRLKDEDERHSIAAQFHQQDLRAQAEIATKAQQDYEHELVKHAEAAKALQHLRAEHNHIKSETAGLKAEAESAKVTLSQSQASWEERRLQFEKELQELRTRRDDTAAQNAILMQQLESVSAQVTTLQQSRSSFVDTPETEAASSTATPDRSIEGLRELVAYLRRDKEIVDVQYELAMQESKRLKQQLDYSHSQMDEARLKLDQERRSQADASRSSLAHKDIMEKLNELNLLRESNNTLRNESHQAQAQLAEKTKQVEELMETIQPLEGKVRELENAKEMQDGEIRLLQEDRDRWQKRNQEILSKYDRIDPAEMEKLKESLATLQAERDALSSGQEPLQDRVKILESTLESEKATWQVSRQKLIEQAKERSRTLTKDRNDRVAERDAVIQEKEALEKKLETVQSDLESAIQEKKSFEEQLTTIREELETAKAQIQMSIQDSGLTKETESASQTQHNDALDKQIETLRKELEVAIQEKHNVEHELATVRRELETARSERDQALARATQAEAGQGSKITDTEMSDGMEEGQVTESSGTVISDERKALEERAAAAEARAKQIEESMDATLRARSEKMKTLLNNRLKESKESTRAELEAQFNLKLEQEKQIWLAENKIAGPSAPPQSSQNEVSSVPAQPPTPTTAKPSGLSDADLTNMSDTQVRTLLTTNPTVKSIVSSNIRSKLEIEKQRLTEAFEKQKQEIEKTTEEKLAEAAKKAEEAKIQAVNMETKKSALKLNMTDNRAKAAAAKLQVVEKAATETPEKPVGEVWEVAKNAKPPVPAPGELISLNFCQLILTLMAPAAAPAASVSTIPAPTTKVEAPISAISHPSAASAVQPAAILQTPPASIEATSQAAPQQPNGQQAVNGTSSIPVSNIPAVSYFQAYTVIKLIVNSHLVYLQPLAVVVLVSHVAMQIFGDVEEVPIRLLVVEQQVEVEDPKSKEVEGT